MENEKEYREMVKVMTEEAESNRKMMYNEEICKMLNLKIGEK